jgi:hypothetical protein
MTLCLLLLAILPNTYAADAPPAEQTTKPAAELNWTEPYEAAQLEAKQTGRPMMLFFAEPARCKMCEKFVKEVCNQQEFIDYAKDNLVCSRIDYGPTIEKTLRGKNSALAADLNIPHAHAVLIVRPDGVKIGELSTETKSVSAFIEDIKNIIAKAPQDGRLKFTEVELLDKKYVPEKTYSTPLPEFSKKPLTGRYITFMSAIRVDPWENTRSRSHGEYPERGRMTVKAAMALRNSLAEGFPGASMTWAWSWGALNEKSENFLELRKLMVQFHKQYRDEVTFWPGVYFANKFSTHEQCKKDLHEGLQLVSEMMGDGYRPKSVIAGSMSIESMKYLASQEGIHVVQGAIWSQFEIDGQNSDGGIIYPYYPAKDHFLKPAQGPRGGDDFVDMVNVDGWTVDFFAGRLRATGGDYNSRVGLGPIETRSNYGFELGHKEFMHVTDVHFNDQTVKQNGFGFLTVIWELPLFDHWLEPEYLSGWLKAVRARYPDTQMLTLGEFGELWRKHNPDNSRMNLKFVERGNDMPSLEEGKKIYPNYRYHGAIFKPEMEIRWYFNKDFRFATMQNWKENGPALVVDYTRYDLPYVEPGDNVRTRYWDLLGMINQKQSRPQDKPRPFAELPIEDQQRILKWYPDVK